MKVKKIETMLYHDLVWYTNKLGVSVKKMVRVIDKEFRNYVGCPICPVMNTLTKKQHVKFRELQVAASEDHRDPEPYYDKGASIWDGLCAHERVVVWDKVKTRFKKERLI